MPKKPFDQLTIVTQRRFRNLGFTKKENTGVDTETNQGYVRLIADNTGDYKIVDNLLEILQFLTRTKFRNSFNWFYNIKYDFESIIKYLDEDELYELYYEKHIQYERYHIQYLDKKFLGIKDRHGNYYYYYDLFNFLEASLDNASKKFLDDKKLEYRVCAKRLNLDWSYWELEMPRIIKYCIKDADLTKRLADYFWDLLYKHLDYYPKRPFSKGKLSEEYFMRKCYIPTINDIPKQVLKYAYNSYSGGRFEILRRGYFPNMFTYDISSAYPHEMTKLMDYSKGKWLEVDDMSPDVDIGFYHCYVSAMELNFSPFLVKRAMLNCYPNGRFYQYMNSNEIKFIRENFQNCDIKILKGYEFMPLEELYPLKEEIERLYEWKEKEKDADIKYCVKIILNSLYGKTIQTISGRTGKMFNPIWASLITSGTRLKLLEMALKSPENIIAFSTDSVASTTFLKSPEKPKLGDFKFEFQGSGIYLMSDVYTLWNNKKLKNKFRGFKVYKDTIPTIIDNFPVIQDRNSLLGILTDIQKSTTYDFKRSSPYHLGECLIHTKVKSPSMINIFHESTKTIDINGDIKRHWERKFENGKDAMENSINSYPLKF